MQPVAPIGFELFDLAAPDDDGQAIYKPEYHGLWHQAHQLAQPQKSSRCLHQPC